MSTGNCIVRKILCWGQTTPTPPSPQRSCTDRWEGWAN